MNVAKPEDGFHVRFTPESASERDEICNSDVDQCRRLSGLVERIRQVGHVEGTPVEETQPAPTAERVMTDVEADHIILAKYRILGDTVTILSIGAIC